MKFQTKKSLGQNFLHDPNILKNIARSTNATKKDLIVEIGPGMGALTKELVKTESKVISFEIDTRLKEYLDKIDADNLKIVYDDFMKVDLKKYISEDKYDNVYVIANIPYYITTPIIKKILSSDIYIKNVVLLVQKEFADRICAKCGTREYDSLTVYLSYYYNINKLFNVSASSFTPRPKVDSAVIKLSRKSKDIKDNPKLFKIVDNAFKFKRKTLKNNLKMYDWNIVKNVLNNYKESETVRAEQLPLEFYIELSQVL